MSLNDASVASCCSGLLKHNPGVKWHLNQTEQTIYAPISKVHLNTLHRNVKTG